jgi:DNA-binding beta-propeller fold protein YncE
MSNPERVAAPSIRARRKQRLNPLRPKATHIGPHPFRVQYLPQLRVARSLTWSSQSLAVDPAFGTSGTIGSGSPGSGNGQFNLPFDVALSPDGLEIAVSDSGNHRIERFSASSGTFIAAFGQQGSGTGQFNTPKGLAYDSLGYLYVVDSGNSRIVLAQASGIILGTSGTGTALGQLQGAINLAVGTRGIYAGDAENNRVQFFEPLSADDGAVLKPSALGGTLNPILSGA